MDADEALASLIADAGERLLRLAYQLTHDRAAAEDVVQEALMNMYRSWRRHAPEIGNTTAYARRAVVNEYLRRRRLRSAGDVVMRTPPDVRVDSGADAAVDRDVIWRALRSLPPRQRAVLVLRFYEDLPDARIAELLGAREATVRSLALRGLTALRRHPEALLGEMT